MGRKVAYVMALIGLAVMSVVLVGGQVGTGQYFENGNHEPIYIYGDGDFTEANGVRSGDGSRNNPYLIEGWTIDAPNADYGIYVDHTTEHFIIRDCIVERARIAGVYFNTVKNALVEHSQISLSDVAVYLMNAQANKFSRNTVMHCRSGIVMGARARENVVALNAFIENGRGGYDPSYANQWFDECRGNYWSDYDGIDANADGIGDVPYHQVRDLMPLMAPPSDDCEQPEPDVPAEAPTVVLPAEPTTVEPAVEEPAVTEPIVEEPMVEDPAVETEPPAEEPEAVEEPPTEEQPAEPAESSEEEAVAPAEELTLEPAAADDGEAAEEILEEEPAADEPVPAALPDGVPVVVPEPTIDPAEEGDEPETTDEGSEEAPAENDEAQS